MATNASRYFDSDGTIVEYRKPAETTWTQIIGVGDISTSGGEPPSTDVNTLQATYRAYGRATPEAVSMTMPGVQVGHSSYNALREALAGGTQLFFRWRLPTEVVLYTSSSGNTAAISTAGVITLTGTNHVDLNSNADLGPGVALKILTDYYVLATTPADGALSGATLVNAPATAVSTSAYTLVKPPIYQPEFSARVESFTSTRAFSAPVTATLTLGLTSPLPAEKVGTPA